MRFGLFILTFASAPAFADIPPPPASCADLPEGDACTTADGADGRCDSEGACIAVDAPADTSSSGCTSIGTSTAAVGSVFGALTLLAVGRRA
jgi:hypothetical protein